MEGRLWIVPTPSKLVSILLDYKMKFAYQIIVMIPTWVFGGHLKNGDMGDGAQASSPEWWFLFKKVGWVIGFVIDKNIESSC